MSTNDQPIARSRRMQLVVGRLATSDHELIVGLADGRLLQSTDRGALWSDTGLRAGPVVALAAR